MLHTLAHVLAVIGVAGSACGMGYYFLCLWGARSFRRDAQTRWPEFAPPVSILKPLRGTDPDIYEAFRSHCLQEYPEYEIIFGVSEADDPVAALVKQLQREFPQRAIKLMVCPQTLGTNRKVSNLVQMIELARYPFVIVNDSDIRVPPDYLKRVMAPMESPDVGMVTCMYRGQASATLGSRLEAVGISTEFHAGVLSARQLEGEIRFALGSTLVMSRTSLKAAGGLVALLDYLADDYELGLRIAGAGFRVLLSDLVVDTHLPAYSLREFFDHQLRWARSTRHSRPWGYFGLVLTFAPAWAVLALVAARFAPWVWALLGAVMLLRFAVAFGVGLEVLQDRQLKRDWWLVPLRDIAALLVWASSYAGREVKWRGQRFVLRDGKLHANQ